MVKAWTVKEKREILQRAKGNGAPRDLLKEQEELVAMVKENVLDGIPDIDAEDARFLEKLWTETVAANYYVPLPSGARSAAQSSQTLPAEQKTP